MPNTINFKQILKNARICDLGARPSFGFTPDFASYLKTRDKQIKECSFLKRTFFTRFKSNNRYIICMFIGLMW
ncbi:hypothetical protein CN469_04390 [Bacillus cereus]|nr:hypothetical protein CN469_04390 [Bacillus cereus]